MSSHPAGIAREAHPARIKTNRKERRTPSAAAASTSATSGVKLGAETGRAGAAAQDRPADVRTAEGDSAGSTESRDSADAGDANGAGRSDAGRGAVNRSGGWRTTGRSRGR